MRGALLIGLGLLLHGCHNAPPLRAAPAPAEGWEGFYPPARVTDAWLRQRGIPLDAAAVRQVVPRVVKLVLAGGSKQAPEPELVKMHERYCAAPAVRAWNRKRCAALEARRCAGGQCTYEHFGNCSGLLVGGGRLLTAAHCVAELAEDAALARASEVLAPGEGGAPTRTLRLGKIALGKRDFSHEWVAVREPGAVDAALATVEDSGLEPWPRAPLPERGAVIFMVGYPRAERRTAATRKALSYELVFGTPAVTFGRVMEPNRAGRPFCSVDGNQEHWALAGDCPVARGAAGQRGPITRGAFLTSADTTNGLSGAPVLDEKGRLIGVNVTVAGGIDPQERYGSQAVGVSAAAVARALGRWDLRPCSGTGASSCRRSSP